MLLNLQSTWLDKQNAPWDEELLLLIGSTRDKSASLIPGVNDILHPLFSRMDSATLISENTIGMNEARTIDLEPEEKNSIATLGLGWCFCIWYHTINQGNAIMGMIHIDPLNVALSNLEDLSIMKIPSWSGIAWIMFPEEKEMEHIHKNMRKILAHIQSSSTDMEICYLPYSTIINASDPNQSRARITVDKDQVTFESWDSHDRVNLMTSSNTNTTRLGRQGYFRDFFASEEMPGLQEKHIRENLIKKELENNGFLPLNKLPEAYKDTPRCYFNSSLEPVSDFIERAQKESNEKGSNLVGVYANHWILLSPEK